RKKRQKRLDSPRTPLRSPLPTPPPPPPSLGASGALGTSRALVSLQMPLPPPPPSTNTNRVDFTATQETSPTYYLMNDDSIPDKQVHLSDDEDTGNDHLPKADLRKDWWKPLPEEERPTTLEPAWTIPSSNVSDVENNWASALVSTYEPTAENSLLAKTGDMTTFMNWYCQKVNKTVLTQADFEGQAYEVANPEGDQVRIDVSRPLPLGGPSGHVTIQTQFFFNKDLEYLRYGNKGSKPALSISKMKAASYPDFRLELLVPEQMWIDEVCTYDISRIENTCDSHFIRIKAYSRYGYDYLSEIVLRRANFQEHKIAEKYFKNLYPSDFEYQNSLLLQGHLDHLPGSDKHIYQTQLNLTKPGWDAKGFKFKHDYTIIKSPRAVVFPVNNNERKIMRFNEIYKFSDGTLTRILEALDYIVKEFKIKRLNPSMNKRFWTQKDVTTSKEFMSAIERRLKTRRIDVFVILTTDFFRERNDLFIPFIRLMCKLGDFDVHTLEDPTLILEILSRRFFLRLNLPDHRSVLTGFGGSSKGGDGDTLFQWSLFHNRMLILTRYI
ncbi:hypothetical protein Tco_1300336, partial [Tanacetum coccineum]